jgi:hypothetical protein
MKEASRIQSNKFWISNQQPGELILQLDLVGAILTKATTSTERLIADPISGLPSLTRC